ELRSVMQTLTEKVTDIVEQDIKSELMATADSLNTRYDEIYQMIISQQELVVKIAKLVGIPSQYTSYPPQITKG
ncbi:hypothetical protein, partial [Paenibacillus foliorum]|uniref:hypothetical protein n=1 Tax=Paenibacillus foliorum TaxID=2654974 RepID=UPI001C126130